MGGLPKRKDRSIILRIYDSLGGKAKGRIAWDGELLPVKKVWRCNALEDDVEDLSAGVGSGKHGKTESGGISDDDNDGGKGFKGVNIGLRAFEVATFRLQL